MVTRAFLFLPMIILDSWVFNIKRNTVGVDFQVFLINLGLAVQLKKYSNTIMLKVYFQTQVFLGAFVEIWFSCPRSRYQNLALFIMLNGK